jgi:hypothetical protein
MAMNYSVRVTAVACGLAASLGLCGCSPTSGKSWGAGNGSITLIENGSRVSYALGRLTRDDRVYFVIVANGFTGGGSGGGEGAYRGQLYGKDGVKIDWSCRTQDGHAGNVIIDGREFDLAAGGLFLVTANEKPARVEQLAVDAEQLQVCADAKRFPELGKADPRVAGFLQSGKDGE